MQEHRKRHEIGLFFAVLAVTYLLPAALFWVTSFLPSTPLNKYLFTVLGSLLVLAIALCAIRSDTVSLEEIGCSRDGLQQAVKIIAIGWMLWGVLIASINYKMGYPFRENFESSLPKIFVQWLFVGIAEEMLFRGYILVKLMQFFAKIGKVWSTVAGIVVSSLIFATYHIPQRVFVHGITLRPAALMGQMVPLFLSGVLLAWLFLRSGRNVLFVGLFHGGINAPPMGREGDLAPVLLFLVLVEIFARRKRKQAAVSDTGDLYRHDEA